VIYLQSDEEALVTKVLEFEVLSLNNVKYLLVCFQRTK